MAEMKDAVSEKMDATATQADEMKDAVKSETESK
ncbi:hypothetical protein SC936_00005 [Aggregatibacter actinomycetemcomitans serotype e str. SC936]|nr:hypothetical protein SC936_00005 [Aggregatibacter actinomycetemcomitans serotype e str. SC936]